MMEDLTPRAIVQELDKYIIGQTAAKRAVAVALRNRYRRRMLPEQLRKEITPKNILMIGPTGVGKSEIARRVARVIDAPFVRVEATKFTEVGYVGRDVDSIVHDLVEASVNMVYEQKYHDVQATAEDLATERIIGYLYQQAQRLRKHATTRAAKAQQQVSVAMSGGGAASGEVTRDEGSISASANTGIGQLRALALASEGRRIRRKDLAELLKAQKLEDAIIEIEVNNDLVDNRDLDSTELGAEEWSESVPGSLPPFGAGVRRRRREVPVREARRLLVREEAARLIDFDQVVDEAIQRVEESGVSFIDEIDKIVGHHVDVGPDVSGEGVQRDLLPIVEGTTVMTRYGPVRTDFILFIAAGAFYQHKPSDLIPELQGRFPLRVELASLSLEDFHRILVEPENAIVKQYQALLETEGVELEFTADGLVEVAKMACTMNERLENIGARRLATIVEQLLEEVSFEAPTMKGEKVVVDGEFVRQRLAKLVEDVDSSKYIL